MLARVIEELRAYKKRERMYQGIQALKKNLDEMRADGRIEDKRASEILVTAVKAYAAMF